MEKEKILLIIYSLYLLISSLITLILYKRDKKIAVTNNGMRIKEKTLLEMVVFGGAIGGLIGTYAFHHKSDTVIVVIIHNNVNLKFEYTECDFFNDVLFIIFHLLRIKIS